jgi:hypothetical protein
MELKKLNKIKLHTLTTLYGEPGSGKAEYIGNIIHTPSGIKLFGDLKVGDFVFDRFGKPTKVVGIFPQGELDAYEVELTDGRKGVYNDEHLWGILTSRNNISVKSLKQLMEEGISKVDAKGNTHSIHSIPTHSWVMYEEKPVDTDPYVLGAFLANGSLSSEYLTLCTSDEFIVSKVADILGYTYKKNSEKNYNWSFYSEEGKLVKTSSINFYGNLGKLSHEKFIPEEYLVNSKEVRLNLLKGLMDNDGTIGAKHRGGKVSYSTSSRELMKDFTRLVGSLGYCYGVSEDKRRDNVNYKIIPQVPNSEKKHLFTLPRKLDRALAVEHNELRKDFKRVGIKAVRPLGKKLPMMCIKVDNEEELYLSNNFIVTHNTTYINSLPGEVLVIDTDRGLASVTPEERFSVAECYTWADVEEAINLANDFDSIAIDHFTNVQELLYKDLMAKKNAKQMSLNLYGEASTILRAFIDTLVRLSYSGKNVYVICQQKSVNVEEVTDENVPAQIIPNLMESVSKYLTASSRILGHTERITKSKIVKGNKKVKDFYQVRLAGNPVYNLKVTRKPGLAIPDTIINPTWDELVGLTDGSTQAKNKKAEGEE